MRRIPIVDFASNSERLSHEIMVDGFVQLTNHGLSSDLIDAVWQQCEEFFALPLADKRKLSRSLENVMGYYDRELTKEKRDQKEIFDFRCVADPDLADDHPRNISAVDGFNQWPDDLLPDFQPTLKEYATACTDLSYRIMEKLAAGLDIDGSYFRAFFDNGHTSFLRLNHYPVDDVLESAQRERATPLGDQALHHHTDAGVLTILLQDSVGGLQARADDRWIDVEPIEGSLVINVGDLMQIWSNDTYKAALHRVRPITAASRYSIPFFFNPAHETICKPIVGHGEEPIYRPVEWGEFRARRAEGDFAGYGQEIQISDFKIE